MTEVNELGRPVPELGKVDSVDVRTIWRHEAHDFTPWLSGHLDLLGDALGMALELVQREAAVGKFSLDILAQNRITGDKVVIENQLAWTDHSHLGQILTYAAGHDARTVIWVTPGFQEEHRAAVDWLNRWTPEEIAFYGVEVSYHSNETLVDLAAVGVRSHIAEPERGRRNWKGREEARDAVYGNRRRIRSERGRRLQRRRGELVERPFAHLYETGGMRGVYLRGHPNILKRLLVHVAGLNLGLLLRQVIGVGTPRGLQGRAAAGVWALIGPFVGLRIGLERLLTRFRPDLARITALSRRRPLQPAI